MICMPLSDRSRTIVLRLPCHISIKIIAVWHHPSQGFVKSTRDQANCCDAKLNWHIPSFTHQQSTCTFTYLASLVRQSYGAGLLSCNPELHNGSLLSCVSYWTLLDFVMFPPVRSALYIQGDANFLSNVRPLKNHQSFCFTYKGYLLHTCKFN